MRFTRIRFVFHHHIFARNSAWGKGYFSDVCCETIAIGIYRASRDSDSHDGFSCPIVGFCHAVHPEVSYGSAQGHIVTAPFEVESFIPGECGPVWGHSGEGFAGFWTMLQGAVLVYPLGVEKFFVLLDSSAYRGDPLVLHGGPAPDCDQQDYCYKYAPLTGFVFMGRQALHNESRLFTLLPHRLRPYDISTVPSRFGRQPGVSIENMVDTRRVTLIRKPHGTTRGLYAAITSLSVEYMIVLPSPPPPQKRITASPCNTNQTPKKGALIDSTFLD